MSSLPSTSTGHKMADRFFCDCLIYILQNGLLKKRIELFEKQIQKYGGTVVSDTRVTPPTHIVIEDKLLTSPADVINALNSVSLSLKSNQCEIVGTLWLSSCLKHKMLVNANKFAFHCKEIFETKEENGDETPVKIRKIEVEVLEKPHAAMPIQVQNDNCSASNAIVIAELQKLADAYHARGDRWRSLAYDKAIISLKSYGKRISNINDLKTLPHMTAKMLDKINEILENGSLSKVEAIYSDEKTRVLEMFGKVWGAGPVTAQLWYQKGLRTLDDLITKGNLTAPQKIALKYYHEIQEPIPRKEVEQIQNVIKRKAIEIEPTLSVLPCGSYRRGKQMCGDVDVLLIVKDSINYRSVLPKIIRELKKDGFLTDDLVGSIECNSCTKYLGLGKLMGKDNIMRRIDIFVAPESESACAIMHYTGSGLFNRGIRLHASKMNMQLSQSALVVTVPKRNVLSTPTERSIFELLNLPYRPPEDRAIF